MSNSRVVYLCDWLPPDFGAVGQYTLGFARERAQAGHDVVLIGLTSRTCEVEEETHGAGRLTIHRLRARGYDKTRFRDRLFWTLETNRRLVAKALRVARDADEVRFTGAPPFLLHFLVPLNLVWRRRLTYRITDFWPECLMAEAGRVPWWLRAFHGLTWRLRRRVDHFEVLGHDQRRRLEAGGIDPTRIELVRDPSPVAVNGDEAPLAVPPEIAGWSILLYSGNWGAAHDTETFVEGFRRHHASGSGRFALWLNAVGSGADHVEARLRDLDLPFTRTRPVPLAELPRLLVTPAAHLITLKDAFVGYVLPSKVYGCLASGRPMIFVGSAASDVHLLGEETLPQGAYFRVDGGDQAGVCAALDTLANRTTAGERSAPGRHGGDARDAS
jgi:hypothetical protein